MIFSRGSVPYAWAANDGAFAAILEVTALLRVLCLALQRLPQYKFASHVNNFKSHQPSSRPDSTNNRPKPLASRKPNAISGLRA